MQTSDMLNIRGQDIESIIKESIEKVYEELSGLEIERTCKIYSSYVLKELKNKHVIARLINTKNIELNYEHEFVIATDGTTSYIVDLTYRQFGLNEPQELVETGYIKCTKENYHKYITAISTLRSQRKL